MNIKAHKARQKLQDFARRTVKDVGYELGEIPKRTPKQITGKDTSHQPDNGGDSLQASPIVEAMQQPTDFDEQELEIKKQKKFIQDKSKIDEDIEKYERKREELQKAWAESQAHKFEKNKNVEPGETLPIPSSKPARGKTNPGKNKSPEKRLGKK